MNSQQREAGSDEFSHIGPAVRLCPARYVVLGTAGVHINPLSATWPGLGHVRPRNVLDSVNSVADFSLSPAYHRREDGEQRTDTTQPIAA